MVPTMVPKAIATRYVLDQFYHLGRDEDGVSCRSLTYTRKEDNQEYQIYKSVALLPWWLHKILGVGGSSNVSETLHITSGSLPTE